VVVEKKSESGRGKKREEEGGRDRDCYSGVRIKTLQTGFL
jgi:hypothetical protein